MTTMWKMNSKQVALMNEMGGTNYKAIYQTNDDDSFETGYTTLALSENGQWELCIENDENLLVFNIKEEAVKIARKSGFDIEVERLTPITAKNPSPYERTRSAVYATGNHWAIENFNLTH